MNPQGQPVADGYYNIQFKIYQDGNGTVAGNPGGTLQWTETHINNGGNNGVYVKNGYLSVNLGSKTPFGTSVDWNQDTLWLSMNIAGSATGCSTFGSAPCAADGEMTPMKRLTAAPLALNSAKLGGIEASGFIQNTTTAQAGSFNILGTGRANVLQGVAGIEAPMLDRGDSGVLAIGSTNATAINIGSSTGDQTINIGTGPGDKSLAIGNSTGDSLLALRGGSSGVQIESAGGFTVRSTTTERDTLSIGAEGNTTINLSTGTGFAVNNNQDQGVLRIGNDGAIETGTESALAVKGTATFSKGVQLGNESTEDEPALLKLDSATGAPLVSDESLLGSMYYDLTLGKVQCYEADGWGACSASPDTFVSLSPEYGNSVINGSGTGTMNSDICSDTLNINDGSMKDDVAQPLICSENETYNFYDWATDQQTAQTKSVYVTYQLPTNFKSFVEGGTSLMARTDSVDATVSYQIYQNTTAGLTECGSLITASNGTKTTWQKSVASGANDPSSCSFAAGDSVVFKINFTAVENTHAYASTLNFAFSND